MTEGELHGNNGDVARYTFFLVQKDKLAVSYFLDHVYQFNIEYRLRPNLNEPFNGISAGFWCSFVAIIRTYARLTVTVRLLILYLGSAPPSFDN